MFPYGNPLLEHTTAAVASIRKSTGPISPAGRANMNGPPQSPVTLPHVIVGRAVSSAVWAYTRPFRMRVQAAAQSMMPVLKAEKSPAKTTPATTIWRSESGSPMSAGVLTNESDGADVAEERKNPK